MKDRYNFDEFYLNKQDEKIAARREARRAKLNRDLNVIEPEEILNNKRRKKYKIEVGKLVLVSVIVIAVVAFVVVYGLKLSGLELEKKEAEHKLDTLQQKQEQLQAELSELDSEEYIESEARSELHMIRDGEVLYVVTPELSNNGSDDRVTAK